MHIRAFRDNVASSPPPLKKSFLGFISQAAKLGTQGAPVCRLFAFEELKEATNGFESARFLGEGSMGKVTPKTKIFIRDTR